MVPLLSCLTKRTCKSSIDLRRSRDPSMSRHTLTVRYRTMPSPDAPAPAPPAGRRRRGARHGASEGLPSAQSPREPPPGRPERQPNGSGVAGRGARAIGAPSWPPRVCQSAPPSTSRVRVARDVEGVWYTKVCVRTRGRLVLWRRSLVVAGCRRRAVIAARPRNVHLLSWRLS